MLKNILVTGGNSGIGLALCKLLIKDHGCYVYLGSRDAQRGATAMKSIIDEVPGKADMIEVVQVDVCNDESCQAAAEALKAQGVKLYALVNNAGVGWSWSTPDVIINTNFYGPKRVTDALIGLIDPEGRIVNVSSGAASMWVKHQEEEIKQLFSNPNASLEDIKSAVKTALETGNLPMKGYGLSKAALCSLTMVQAKENPNLTVVSLSPGLVDTPMTAANSSSNKLTPEQGCLSSIKCLFESVTSGYYYGSDGLRSPLTVTRDPGTPEYQGESDPDPLKYNKS